MSSPHWILQVPEADYYSDKGLDYPALSQSTANTLLTRSPYHAYLEHPKLGGMRRKATKVMDRGTVIHSLLLGGRADIVVLDFDNFRSKASQEARDRAAFQGETPILRKDYENWMSDAQAIKSKLDEFGINLLNGTPEATILWEDADANGMAISCKSRLDHIYFEADHVEITDIKTTASANLDACIKSIINYGYDVQAAAYIRAVERSNHRYAGRVNYTILFIEDSQAQAITPVRLSEGFLTVGRQKWQRAVNIWSDCLKRNEWPSYTNQVVTVQPPEWYVAKADLIELLGVD